MKNAIELRKITDEALKVYEEEKARKIKAVLADIEGMALEAALVGESSIIFEVSALPVGVGAITKELMNAGYKTCVQANGIKICW